eukprot:gene26327-biopygen15848
MVSFGPFQRPAREDQDNSELGAEVHHLLEEQMVYLSSQFRDISEACQRNSESKRFRSYAVGCDRGHMLGASL